jgi:predicted metal-dependent phosphotriesterase family hydrolase
MTKQIRTVLGNIDSRVAGVVDSHDHLFMATPLVQGEELIDESLAAAEVREFARFGGGLIVQWTPSGLHRNIAGLARISADTGVHVVAATGRHREAAYGSDSPWPHRTIDELTAAFIRDVQTQSCGLIKVGTSGNQITSDEVDALHAAAAAHHATGVPIAIHLEQGTGTDHALSVLLTNNVPAHSIILGHLGRNLNERAVKDAAQTGAWLCFDGPSPAHPIPTERLAHTLGMLISEGCSAQLLLGGDTTRESARFAVSGQGPAGLISDTATRLREKLGSKVVETILVSNPSEAWQQRADAS